MSKTDDRYAWVLAFVGEGRSVEAMLCYIPPDLLTTRATLIRWLNHWVNQPRPKGRGFVHERREATHAFPPRQFGQ